MGGGRGRTGSAGGRGGSAGAGGGAIDFTQMTDLEIANLTKQALNANLPASQYSSTTQYLINAAGWTGKPEVVSDAKLQALAKQKGAIVLYRTVNDNASQKASQIASSFRNGNENNIGGWGGQAYGGGHYFSNSLRGSKDYGSGNAHTMGAVLNKKAKIIDGKDLRGTKGQAWLTKHPNAAVAMGFVKRSGKWVPSGYTLRRPNGKNTDLYENAYTTLAMSMGYNVVSNKSSYSRNEKYYTIMDRSAVTTSTRNYYNDNKGLG